jgi:hypothetical protein
VRGGGRVSERKSKKERKKESDRDRVSEG